MLEFALTEHAHLIFTKLEKYYPLFGMANTLTNPLLEEEMQKILHSTKSYLIYDGFCTVDSKKNLEGGWVESMLL